MPKIERKKDDLRIIPLGGLGEVGRNMLLLEYQKKILIVDMGLGFPEESMPGVDYIIPDVSYLEGRKKDIVGAVFTHGHYDHIGAIPYLIDKIGPIPMFAGSLTRGIILKRQLDFPEKPVLDIKTVKDGQRLRLAPFEIEFVRLNHNIPDNFGLKIKTPLGAVFHTSDFKFDKTPIYDPPANLKRFKKIGQEGVLLLMSDSTRAEEAGHSLSEKEIMENLREIFESCQGRIIAATFSSLLNRIQQIISLSEKYQRKVILDGYSMKTNVEIARELGYLKIKGGTIIKVKEANKHPDSKITILCTGAQGEGEAVLMRIANKEHRFLQFRRGDTVIFSSSVVPGNERSVQLLKDNILRQKAEVFHYRMMDIHAGGHGHQQELEQMIRLLKPRFFLPIAGQYSMLVSHAHLARRMKVSRKNIVVAENGQVVLLDRNKIALSDQGVECNLIMVDGLGIGDVGKVVLRDRKVLADDGIFVIISIVDHQTGRVKRSPDIISRGFVYLKESKELLSESRKKVISIINKASAGGIVNWAYLKNEIKEKVGSFLYAKTQRRPMVLPVIIEV